MVDQVFFEIGFDNSLLLVDDDEVFLKCFVKVMEKCGFVVEMVEFVVVGCVIVMVWFLVYVVVDLCLDDGNGLDVVEVLQDKCEDCWVVILMGYGVIVIVVVVVKVGVMDYLVKLVDVQDIVNVLLFECGELFFLLENLMSVDCVCWEYIQWIYEFCDCNVFEMVCCLNMYCCMFQCILVKCSLC